MTEFGVCGASGVLHKRFAFYCLGRRCWTRMVEIRGLTLGCLYLAVQRLDVCILGTVHGPQAHLSPA